MAHTGMSIDLASHKNFVVGDIVTLDDGQYRITKLTGTAIAVVPYEWLDQLCDSFSALGEWLWDLLESVLPGDTSRTEPW